MIKNIKLTSKHVFLIVLVVGALALLLVYFNVFTAYNDKTEALKKSNAELQKQVDDMKQYFDQMGVYSKQSAEMTEAMDELLKDYPGDAREEDAIMTAVAMNNVAIINFDKIAINAPEVILSIPADTVKAAAVENLEGQIDFVERKTAYKNITDYGNLKLAVEQVYKSPYRIGIGEVNYKRKAGLGDPTDLVEGNITISYYSVDGLGREYVAPNMPTYPAGVTQLFGEPFLGEEE